MRRRNKFWDTSNSVIKNYIYDGLKSDKKRKKKSSGTYTNWGQKWGRTVKVVQGEKFGNVKTSKISTVTRSSTRVVNK